MYTKTQLDSASFAATSAVPCTSKSLSTYSTALAALAVGLLVSSCGTGAILGAAASVASSALGGSPSGTGTSVDAKVQIGRENEQAVVLGTKSDTGDLSFGALEISGSLQVSQGTSQKYVSDKVESVVINESNDLLIVLLAVAGAIGWMLPTPSQLIGSALALVRRRKEPKDLSNG
jgi:hypothetical protein